MSQSKKVLALRIQHERELREAEKVAFDHERELRAIFDAHERELRQKSEDAVEKARDIQFREYERRLESLNGEAGRIRSIQETSVTREAFDIYKETTRRELEVALKAREDAVSSSIDPVRSDVGDLKTWRSALEGRIIGVGAAIGVVVVVINIAIHFWK